MENGQVTVVTPIEDTPAYRAGLKSGDIILSINGQPAQELSLQEVVSRIRGPKGSEVELAILHSDTKTPQTVRIVRDSIPLISVKSKKLEDGYYGFASRASLSAPPKNCVTLSKLPTRKPKMYGGIKGIVLDLRNNPGGLLDQAVSVSDTFLDKGVIVSIKGRRDNTGPACTKPKNRATTSTHPWWC